MLYKGCRTRWASTAESEESCWWRSWTARTSQLLWCQQKTAILGVVTLNNNLHISQVHNVFSCHVMNWAIGHDNSDILKSYVILISPYKLIRQVLGCLCNQKLRVLATCFLTELLLGHLSITLESHILVQICRKIPKISPSMYKPLQV